MHPLQAVVDWLDSFSPSQRTDIGFQAGSQTLGFPFYDALPDDDPGVRYRDYVASLIRDDLTDVGGILAVRAAIDLLVANKLDPKGWDRAARLMEKVAESARKELRESSVKQFEQMRETLPDRRAEWEEIARSWDELRNGHLLDSHIEEWQDDYWRRNPPTTL